MGGFYSPSTLDPQAFSVKNLADTLGEKLIEAQYLSEVLGLKIEREDYDQQKGKISLETDRITSTISMNIAKASGVSVNDTLKFSDASDRIKTMEGRVDGLWLQQHGFGGIKVRLKLDNMSQRWVMYHLDGSPVRDFQYVVSTGNIGGAQTKNTLKVYAVAFANNSGSYCILVCPDAEASPIADGMRTIQLNPFITNLVEGAAVSILGNPPFSLRDEAINRLFAPSMTTIAQGGGQ
ncbi:MAG: hypothetical protein Q8Q21_00705 [bacterium]|nr:hypothetical protein [bacterium]